MSRSKISTSSSELDEKEQQGRKEAARQLSIILIKRGVSCTIITSDGFSVPSVLRLGMTNKSLSIFWRTKPEKLGCELRYLQSVSCGVLLPSKELFGFLDSKKCVGLVFVDFKLQLTVADSETCVALQLCLQTLLSEVKATEKVNQQDKFMSGLSTAAYKIAIQQEKLHQLSAHSSRKGNILIVLCAIAILLILSLCCHRGCLHCF